MYVYVHNIHTNTYTNNIIVNMINMVKPVVVVWLLHNITFNSSLTQPNHGIHSER